MADKTLSVRLMANVAAYKSAMRDAATSTQFLSASVQATGDKVTKSLKDIGNASDEHLSTLGTNAGIAGLALAAGLGVAVMSFANFDEQMSNLAAVSGASSEAMDELRQSAIDAGAATVFSASEAAQAQVELAKAGVSASDILGGALTGALNLASAGNLDLAQASTIAANAMTTFHLNGSDVPRVADSLAAAANKSAADVDDMGQALSQSGLVASQLGLSLEDTTGSLAMFAQAGLKGSDAGTSLKTMLMRLTPSSKEAEDAMADLGLEFFDAQGNFVGIENAAEQLQNKLGGLTQENRQLAMQTIFGSDAIRAATILYKEGGDGVGSWVTKVTDAGYAADLAAKKTDNLKGDLEQLKGSFETVLIESGSDANSAMRSLTQGMTDFINGVGAAPGPVGTAAVGITGLASAGLLTVGAVGTLIPKVREVNTALQGMGSSGQMAATGMKNVGTAFAVAAPGMIPAATLWGNIEEAGRAAVTELTKGWDAPESFSQQAGQINQLIAEYERLQGVAADGGFMVELGQNLNPFAENTISDAEAATRELEGLIDDNIEANGRWEYANYVLQQSLGLTQDEVDELARKAGIDLSKGIGEVQVGMEAFAAEMSAAPPLVMGMSGSLDGLTDKTQATEEKFQDLNDVLDDFYEASFGGEEAADRIQRSMNRLSDSMQDPVDALADARDRLNALPGDASQEQVDAARQAVADAEQALAESRDFTGTSDASLEYRDQMRGLTQEALDQIAQWSAMGIQGDELKAKVQELKDSLYEQAAVWGVPREEADKYFAKLDELPEDVYTNIYTPGITEAQGEVATLQGQLDKLKEPINIPISVNGEKQPPPGKQIIGYTPITHKPIYADADGGRKLGGPVSAGSMYEVVEGGIPEMLNMGSRSYLMMGSQSGHVTPMTPAGGSGIDYDRLAASVGGASQRQGPFRDINVYETRNPRGSARAMSIAASEAAVAMSA